MKNKKNNKGFLANQYIKEFQVDVSYLTKEELALLNKLIEAAKLIAKVYQTQLQDGFYPKDATRQEIEKAASHSPEILTPYTLVERDKSGQLVAIPYHIKYRDLLLPVSEKLTEAASLAIHRGDFRKALLTQAKVLLNGDYAKAQISWMKIKPYIVDIMIGPVESVEDNMFFIKTSYQSWVGVMNKNVTDRINSLKKTVFLARHQILPTEKVDFMDQAQLRADETIIFTGSIANYDYTAVTATTLPDDINLLEKYGSEGWIFLPPAKENFEHWQYRLFTLIFAPFFRKSFSKELLFRGYLLMVTMHEIARIVVRYRFAVNRLRELYPTFNELTIEALAIKMCGTLLLKDVISQKEMEAVLVMFLTRIFDGYVEGMKNKERFERIILGNAILLNSLVDEGSVKITKAGISWPNFTKMFISVAKLADDMERILAEGSYADAQTYLKDHSSLSVFKNFTPSLKSLLKT